MVDIRHWLQQDAVKPMAVRHRRDREVAITTLELDSVSSAQPQPDRREQLSLVLGWWQTMSRQSTDAEIELPGSRINQVGNIAPVVLGLIGLLLGIAAAAAGLAYDGRHPVNLIAVLMLLVGIPGLFLLLSLLLLPGRLPGLGWLQRVLASLNVGQWLTRWMAHGRWRQQVAATAEELVLLQGWQNSRSGFAKVGKWLMLSFAQLFTLGFFCGVLATLLALVSFSDLAFGWSTTLEVPTSLVVSWVQGSSWPWASWLPAAAPSAELVARSQYFRATGVGADAAMLGGWWPYLFMCVLVYGLLPRLLLWCLSRWRLRVATQGLLLDDPQVEQLQQRLFTPWVERRTSAPETDIGTATDGAAAAVPILPAGGYVVMVWHQALSPAQAQQWVASLPITVAGEPLAAGSREATAAAQQQLRQQLDAGAAEHVLLLTKGWEPPLLELHDVLRSISESLSGTGRLYLQPLALQTVELLSQGEVPINALSKADQEIWAQSIASLQSPKILMVNAGV